MKLKSKRVRKTFGSEIQIRDAETDNNDLVAIVPMTGDKEYDKEVMVPFSESICALPIYLKQVEAAEQLLVALSECNELLKFAEGRVDSAITRLRELLKKG